MTVSEDAKATEHTKFIREFDIKKVEHSRFSWIVQCHEKILEAAKSETRPFTDSPEKLKSILKLLSRNFTNRPEISRKRRKNLETFYLNVCSSNFGNLVAILD